MIRIQSFLKTGMILGLAVLLAGCAEQGEASREQAEPEQAPQSQEAAGVLIAQNEPLKGPRIEFDQPVFNFGKAVSGEEIPHEFTFTNPGDETLILHSVHPTCGCTTSGGWTKTLEPGETGKIPLLLKTAGFQGDIRKDILVRTNAVPENAVTIWFEGHLWQPIEMTPRLINFGSVIQPNEPLKATVQIKSNLEEPLEIKGIRVDNPVFKAVILSSTMGKEFQLEIQANPPFSPGLNRATIAIETSYEKQPQLSIQASCFVPAPVQVTPQRIILPASPLAQNIQKVVYITHNLSDTLKIFDVSLNADNVTLETFEDIPGKRFRIVMNFSKGFSIEDHEPVELKLKTNEESASQISVVIDQVRPRGAAMTR